MQSTSLDLRIGDVKVAAYIFLFELHYAISCRIYLTMIVLIAEASGTPEACIFSLKLPIFPIS
jgi:hypothetical protein